MKNEKEFIKTSSNNRRVNLKSVENTYVRQVGSPCESTNTNSKNKLFCKCARIRNRI